VICVEKASIKVDGMSCSHCTAAVTKAVRALEGVSDVKVSLEAGTADVEFDPGKVTVDRIKAEIAEEGYDCP
jgi:copper chaperone